MKYVKRLSLFILIFIFTDIHAQFKPSRITEPVTGNETPRNDNQINYKLENLSNHFKELKTATGTVLFSPTGIHTIYDLQSNSVPQTIWQDPLNPSNVHAVFMQSFQSNFSDRYTIYLFSNDYGATWTNIGSVPSLVRSGFPSIDGFTNGAAVIANHNVDFGTTPRTKIYYDSGPGFGVFNYLDPGFFFGIDPQWPKLVCLTGNKISFLASLPNIPETNSILDITPPGVFSGYTDYEGDNGGRYAIARSSDGIVGHAYIADVMSNGDVLYRYSVDNGQTWSTPLRIWDWNATPGLGALSGIDIVFQNNQPYVVFNLSLIDETTFYPLLPSSIAIWSPNINGGIPKIIADSSNVPFFPNKGNSADNFLPVCKPSIGSSSSGNYIAVGFSATTGLYSAFDSSSFFSGWITYSGNSGTTWTNPEKITPETPLRDWRYLCVSKSNNLTTSDLTVQMVCQSDSVAGTFVIGGSPVGNAELIGLRFTTSASSIPSAPQLVSPFNGEINVLLTPLLDWNNVSNAISYRAQLARDTTFLSILIDQSNLTVSQFSVPPSILSYDSLYYWRVNATNSNGTSIWSQVWRFRTVTFLPPAPVLLSPPNNSQGNSTTPTLDWSDVPSASNYRVQVALDSNFTSLVINQANLPVSQYIVPSSVLSLNTIYYWRSNATNSNGTGNWSATWRFSTISIPIAPLLLSPANGSTGNSLTPLLDWGDISNANSYRLQLSLDSNFTSNIINQANISVSQFAVSSSLLTYNTKYYWRVNATNIAGTGEWSLVWNFTTSPLQLPTAPLLISPTNGSVNISINPLLDWNNVLSADSYKVQIGLDLNFVLVILDSNISQSQFFVPPGLLTYNSLYFWRINATNSIGTGPWSSTWHFRTALPIGISMIGEKIPDDFSLKNNYPNPFNPSTNIEFDLPKESFVKMKIYDFTGREIKELINEELSAGSYRLKFNAENLASGIYFYRMQTENFVNTKTMLLLK